MEFYLAKKEWEEKKMVSYFQTNNIKNLRNDKNNNNKILTHNKLMYGTSRKLENEKLE